MAQMQINTSYRSWYTPPPIVGNVISLDRLSLFDWNNIHQDTMDRIQGMSHKQLKIFLYKSIKTHLGIAKVLVNTNNISTNPTTRGR